MKSTLPPLRTRLAIAFSLVMVGPVLLAATPFHFGLARSVPADEATVHEVLEVKLWFTQSPSEGTVSIRLIDAAGEAVATSEPTRDPEDDKAVSIAPSAPLEPGNYTIAWRGMGDDGHSVRGDFGFTVAGH
ncbi:MAG: copper resistance protein CopC [Gemmatimonadota bacterium]|nr:copper resistance protein CopC [Gemmatimonadota bacterium]MDH5759792.1 copper resistance protein CopC [Gemmatimonadota bacterium]